jgi:hypothetical protein
MVRFSSDYQCRLNLLLYPGPIYSACEAVNLFHTENVGTLSSCASKNTVLECLRQHSPFESAAVSPQLFTPEVLTSGIIRSPASICV